MTNIYFKKGNVGLSVIEIIVGCSNDWLDFNNVIQIECLLLKIKNIILVKMLQLQKKS